MQSVERGETEAGPGGAFSSGAGACPSRGGKSPPRGKMEARRARRFHGRWLSSFLFSLSQAAPSVSCTVVLGTGAVLLAGDHFPILATGQFPLLKAVSTVVRLLFTRELRRL